MKFLRALTLITLSCLSRMADCQIARIDSLVTAANENHSINGNILVSEKGRILYERSVGYANTETNRLNDGKTRFQLASIGKTFTAVAILQLKEKNQLKLDDYVVQYLPSFPFQNITVRQLLSHTSGLPDLQIFKPLVDEQPERIIDNSVVIEALKRYGKLEFEPGERWAYSNPGYCILALIVERVTKQKFVDYLASNIWRKCSMNDTYPYSAAMSRPDPLRAQSYRVPIYAYQLQRVDTMRRYKSLLINFGGLQGLGFIASTTTDLMHFDRALSNGTLLKQQTVDEAYEPAKVNSGAQVVVEPGKLTFGLGWFIATDTTAGRIVSHSGFIPGGATALIRNVSRQRSVIVLDNAESDGLHQTAENIMNILSGKRLAPQKKSLIKIYTNDLITSGVDYAAARFQQMKADTAQYRFSPGEMDYAAHELFSAGYKSAGLEASKLLTFVEPGAWQTFNSYAELLTADGKVKEAKIMFRRSLTLNPENHFAREALSKLGTD